MTMYRNQSSITIDESDDRSYQSIIDVRNISREELKKNCRKGEVSL